MRWAPRFILFTITNRSFLIVWIEEQNFQTINFATLSPAIAPQT